MKRAETAVAGAALLAWAPTLAARAWIRDDRALILENPLLAAAWPANLSALTGGYHQAVLGANAPVHEWRPALTATFLLERAAFGAARLPYQLTNIALHAAVAVLVHALLRRRLGARAALAGALLFAVLPVHAESVAFVTSRSELLAALGVLGAWLCLDEEGRAPAKRLAAGVASFAFAVFSKEHAFLFPALLALSDWVFHGSRPWDKTRRPVYAALAAVCVVALSLRALVLPELAGGGVPYFAGVPLLSKLLTLSRYWATSYLFPAVTGLGLCADYSRPAIPDSGLGDAAAWAALASILALVGGAVAAVRRRRAWGFWVLAPLLFLLPTSHLIFPLDTIGAQRFLYLPSLALAAAAGAAFAAAERRALLPARSALVLLLLAFGARAATRASDWRDDESYYRAALACHPASARARLGLGLARLRAGDSASGRALLLEAEALSPRLFEARYGLALLAWNEGRFDEAAARAAAALELWPRAADALNLKALLAERAGRDEEALAALLEAEAAQPHDSVTRFNLGRLLAKRGRAADAVPRLQSFLALAPEDPDAPAARRLLDALTLERPR